MPTIDWDGDDDFSRAKDNSGFVQDDLADHPAGMGRGYNVGSLTEGLVAYYPMEKGQGEVLLDGATGNHGQINGASWNGSGQVGNDALSFDGTDDDVDIPSFNTFSEYTVSLWVYNRNVSNSEDYAISIADNNNLYIRQIQNGGHIDVNQWDDTGTFHSVSGPSISDNTWYHVVQVWDGSTLYGYQDGTRFGSTSVPSMDSDNATNSIGTISARDDRVWDGLIDDVRIYDRALSQPEIEALSNRTAPSGREVTESDVPTQSDNGVSRYEFENDVNDSWGSNDGTDNTSDGFATGVYGQAKKFDGTDDYVDLNALDPNGTFTITFWVNTSQSDSTMIYGETSGISVCFGATIPNSGELDAQVQTDQNFVSPLSSTVINDGDWHFGVISWDGSTVYNYVDGVLENTASLSGTLKTPDSTDIGRRPVVQDNYYGGQIDDMRIYDRSLTPSEVEQLYNKGAYRINRGDIV